MPNTIDVRNFTSAAGTTTAGIQEAINALPAAGGIVFIPSGTYAITSTIKTPATAPVVLVGEGRDTTVISMGSSAQKDIHIVELKGNNSQLRQLSLTGCGVAGKGRGVQVGRATADSTGGIGYGFLVEDLHIQNTPSWAVAFYGNDATVEASENGLDQNINGFSISIDSTVQRIRTESTGRGGLFVASGCTTITARKMLVRAWDVSPGIRFRKATDCLVDDCIVEGPTTEQIYYQIDGSLRCVLIKPYCEMDALAVPTKYFIDLTHATSTSFYSPSFTRHTGTGGAALFLTADTFCARTDIYSPTASLDVAASGTHIAKNTSSLQIIGYGTINQPGGPIDMVVT